MQYVNSTCCNWSSSIRTSCTVPCCDVVYCVAQVEMFRQIRSIHYLLPSAALQAAFGVDCTQLPVWARHYTFVKSGKLLAVIFECFNPALVSAL